MQKLTFQLTYPTRGTTHGSQVLIIDPKFQLTYPLRGTTGAILQWNIDGAVFQLTYPLRGTTWTMLAAGQVRDISTHVPPAGYDARRV